MLVQRAKPSPPESIQPPLFFFFNLAVWVTKREVSIDEFAELLFNGAIETQPRMLKRTQNNLHMGGDWVLNDRCAPVAR